MLSQALLTHASLLSRFYNYRLPHSSGYLASTDGLLGYARPSSYSDEVYSGTLG